MNNVIRHLRPKASVEHVDGTPQKKCKGFPICKKTLPASSDFEDCEGCRRHDKKWGADDVDIADIEKWYNRAEVAVYRFAKHLGRKVSTVRKRA